MKLPELEPLLLDLIQAANERGVFPTLSDLQGETGVRGGTVGKAVRSLVSKRRIHVGGWVVSSRGGTLAAGFAIGYAKDAPKTERTVRIKPPVPRPAKRHPSQQPSESGLLTRHLNNVWK